MKNAEIEIQVEIENIRPLVKLLKSKGEFLYEEHQIDQYYTPVHRDFREKDPINEWLRLRDSDGKYSVTYKNWHRNKTNESYHCDEFNSDLGDADQVERILKAMDFKKVVKVDKVRKAYNYKNYEIAIDTVRGLGKFVEIEYKGKKIKDLDVIKNGMVSLLKSLPLGKISRNSVGYAYKLLRPKGDHLEEEL